MMVPEAFLTHAIPGRIRIRIPSKKGDEGYFLSLKDRFSKFPGIQEINVNPLTGSLLVIHPAITKSLDINEIAKNPEFSNLFNLEIPTSSYPSYPPIRAKIAETYQAFDQKMKDFTAGELDIPTLAFLILIGVGILEITAGNFGAPAWTAAFWYALNIFLKSPT